jgi:heme-degrading monooxygenase HmoA
MIRVLVGYKVKRGEDIQPMLVKLRANALQYKGFIGDEMLQSHKNSSTIVKVSTWDSVGMWQNWENSSLRQELQKELKEFLDDEPRISSYRIVQMR